MTTFKIKRIYEKASPDDGYRVLVDRLWPRGVSKVSAKLDDWCKDVAPSNELRIWFGHDPAKFREFKIRYLKELAHNTDLQSIVREWKKYPQVTLLYAAHDEVHNHPVVLLGKIKTV